MVLGNRVKARRKELKMNQSELAVKMGYQSRSSINKIESGRPVSQQIVVRLAHALDTTVPYLMGWDDDPEGQASFDASVLQDEDVMELVYSYLALNDAKKAAVKQMVKALSAT